MVWPDRRFAPHHMADLRPGVKIHDGRPRRTRGRPEIERMTGRAGRRQIRKGRRSVEATTHR